VSGAGWSGDDRLCIGSDLAAPGGDALLAFELRLREVPRSDRHSGVLSFAPTVACGAVEGEELRTSGTTSSVVT